MISKYFILKYDYFWLLYYNIAIHIGDDKKNMSTFGSSWLLKWDIELKRVKPIQHNLIELGDSLFILNTNREVIYI